MKVQINPDVCAGCGICMDECPSGAIHMLNGYAQIDQKLCTGCQTCVEICPMGAIEVSEHQPQQALVSQQAPTTERALVPGQVQASKLAQKPQRTTIIQPSPTASKRSFVPIAGAALGYMGREVLPRFMDALVTALENRITKPVNQNNLSTDPTPTTLTTNTFGRGQGRQMRCRGGRKNIRNRKGRR